MPSFCDLFIEWQSLLTGFCFIKHMFPFLIFQRSISVTRCKLNFYSANTNSIILGSGLDYWLAAYPGSKTQNALFLISFYFAEQEVLVISDHFSPLWTSRTPKRGLSGTALSAAWWQGSGVRPAAPPWLHHPSTTPLPWDSWDESSLFFTLKPWPGYSDCTRGTGTERSVTYLSWQTLPTEMTLMSSRNT